MAAEWEWADFWAYLRKAPPKVQDQMAKQLDLVHWLRAKSGRVQVEVLLGAPEEVIASLYKSRAVPRSTIFALSKKGKNAELMGLGGVKHAA